MASRQYRKAKKSKPVDENQRLAVCGDWTRQGRVEAAFLRAEKTAQALYKITKKETLT